MGSARSNSSKESLVSSSTVSDRPKATIVEPFSFETRDRQLQERRQIKIQKVFFSYSFEKVASSTVGTVDSTSTPLIIDQSVFS